MSGFRDRPKPGWGILLFPLFPLGWCLLRTSVADDAGHWLARVLTSPWFVVPAFVVMIALVVFFVRKEHREHAGEPLLREVPVAGAAGVVVPVAFAGVWTVVLPLSGVALYGGSTFVQSIPSELLTIGFAIVWASVPFGVAVWWTRQHRDPDEAEGSGRGSLDSGLELREATGTDVMQLHEVRIALPAAAAGELERVLGRVPASRAHRGYEALGSRFEEGVRVAYARRSFGPSGLKSELDRLRAELDSRSYRELEGSGFRGAAKEARGREGSDGFVVVSFAIAAYPTGEGDEEVTTIDALRKRLERIVPINPKHVICTSLARCPAAGRVLDESELGEAFPELRALTTSE